MGPLLHSCVEVCEPVELSFGMVSGVGPGIDVLDWVHVPRGIFFGICAPIHLNGRNDVLFFEKRIRLACEKLTVFPYVSLAF